MKKIILILAFLFTQNIFIGQTKEKLIEKNYSPCIKKFRDPVDKKITPLEICLDKNYIVIAANNETNFNNDSIKDFYFYYENTKLKEGDSTFLSFYTLVNGKWTLFKKYGNLFPIYIDYLKRRKKGITNTKDKLTKIYYRFFERNPLSELTIKDDIITIEIYAGEANQYKKLSYKFNKNAKDWLMYESLLLDRVSNTEIKYEDENIGKSVSEFNYLDYFQEN